MAIPVTSSSVRTQWLHPEYRKRLEALAVDRRVAGKWRARSAGRTKAEQAALYRKFLNGTGNLAADPNRVIGRTSQGWVAKGSWHMVQDDDFAHAVDFTISGISWSFFHAVCQDHGIQFHVPGENWHGQWRDLDEIYPVLAPVLPPFPSPPSLPLVGDMKFRRFIKFVDSDYVYEQVIAGDVSVKIWHKAWPDVIQRGKLLRFLGHGNDVLGPDPENPKVDTIHSDVDFRVAGLCLEGQHPAGTDPWGLPA